MKIILKNSINLLLIRLFKGNYYIFTSTLKHQNNCSKLYHSLTIEFDVVNTSHFLGDVVAVAGDVVAHKLNVVREHVVSL